MNSLAALLAFLRDAVTENIGLKLLSLAFALGLFAYLHGQEDLQQRTIPVGVVLRLPPDDLKRELMTPLPASIHVTLRGSARAIDRLLQSGVAPVEIDLRKGERDDIAFDSNMFSFPADVEVAIIDPPTIHLEWQDVVARRIPIQASITGTPADGYIVKGEPNVEPAHIEASGPENLIEVVQFARAAAFDVTGLTEGVYRRRIAIDAPPNRLEYRGPQSATVTVTIARRVSEVKFAKRVVEVVGLAVARVTPKEVDVTVTGPPEVVRALRPEQIVPQADVTQLEQKVVESQHGTATVPLRVDLANAEAEIQPPTVMVRW